MLGIVSGRAPFLGLRASLLAALGLSVAACSGGSGGSGGNAGSAGSGGTGGTGGTATKSCDNATPILQPTGEPSGFVKCADGSIDRVEQVTCVLQNKDTCMGTEETLGCTTAADCVAKPNGVCLTQQLPGGTGSVSACGCVYPCQTDADCGTGKACVCAGVSPVYFAKDNAFCSDVGACGKGADCASGECGYTEYTDGCSLTLSVVCRDSADECRTSAGCIGGQQCSKTTANGAWTCMDQTCTIGRPLLVGDALLFAPAVRRADWADEPLCPDTTSLTPDVRAALAAHFTAMAAMEHASIGSFARFALELLALGAPPALLRATHEAAADEIVHARLSYSLASAYAGEPIGPGRLCVTGVAPSTDERAIVRALVREACVGETVAAAEALALSGMVADPALAEVHARVSEDEARHAELGWRSLAWMLQEHPSLAETADKAFVEAMESMSAAPLVASDVVSPEHGLLSSAALASLRAKALVDVVEPCRRALLASLPAPRSAAGATEREAEMAQIQA